MARERIQRDTELGDAMAAAEDCAAQDPKTTEAYLRSLPSLTADAVELHDGETHTLWRITTKSREVIRETGVVNLGHLKVQTDYGSQSASISMYYNTRRAALETALRQEQG